MLKEESDLIRKPLSMLGHPKYRHKEEKKKMLKMSLKKLEEMENTEEILRRTVLINNTMKRLKNNGFEGDKNTSKDYSELKSRRVISDKLDYVEQKANPTFLEEDLLKHDSVYNKDMAMNQDNPNNPETAVHSKNDINDNNIIFRKEEYKTSEPSLAVMKVL